MTCAIDSRLFWANISASEMPVAEGRIEAKSGSSSMNKDEHLAVTALGGALVRRWLFVA